MNKLAVPHPPNLTMVEANFEEDSVAAVLERSTLDFERPLFVSWLGVLPYLTTDAIAATLDQLPPCTAAISYALPLDACDATSRRFAEAIAGAIAGLGEPFLTLTTSEETASLLETGDSRSTRTSEPKT